MRQHEVTETIGMIKYRVNRSGTVLSWSATAGGGSTVLHQDLPAFYHWLSTVKKGYKTCPAR